MANKKKTRQYRDLTAEELEGELAKLQEQFFMRRFTSDPKRIQNPGKFKAVRRDIARIKTILRERERDAKEEASTPAVAAE